MEDVAADQAEGALQIERAQDLPAEHARLEARRVARRPCRSSDRRPSPRDRPTSCRREIVGSSGATCWQKRLATCWPGGARMSSSVEGISISTIGCARPAVRARVEVGAVHVGERRRDDDAGGVMVGARLARAGGEIRQLGQRDVHAERARAASASRRCARGNPPGSAPVDEPLEQQLRIEVRDDDRRPRTASPPSVTTPTARPFSTRTSRTGAVGSDLDAARGAARRHRLRDRAHAADRVAPHALLAVHLAEHVVQQHIGRARRVGARIVADDAVEAKQRP